MQLLEGTGSGGRDRGDSDTTVHAYGSAPGDSGVRKGDGDRNAALLGPREASRRKKDRDGRQGVLSFYEN